MHVKTLPLQEGDSREGRWGGGGGVLVLVLMGGRCPNDKYSVDGTTSAAPQHIVRGGEGSPEGDGVADVRPGGKVRAPHPAPPSDYWQTMAEMAMAMAKIDAERGGGGMRRRQWQRRRQVPIVPPWHPHIHVAYRKVISTSEAQSSKGLIRVPPHQAVHSIGGRGEEEGGEGHPFCKCHRHHAGISGLNPYPT